MVITLLAGVVVLSGVLVGLNGWRWTEVPAGAKGWLWGVGGASLLLLAEMGATRFAVVGIYAQAYQIPFSKVELPAHGTGFPLYLSLGFVSNPYNIAWEDELAIMAHRLATGKPLTWDMAGQARLVAEWKRIVMESPFLVLKNIAEKALFLHRLLCNSLPLSEQDLSALSPHAHPGPLFFWLYVSAVVVVFLLGILLGWKQTSKLFLFSSGVLGCSAGALLAPVLIYPGYPADVYGLLIAIVAVVLPGLPYVVKQESASLYLPIETDRRACKRAIWLVALIVITLVGTGSAWGKWRSLRNSDFADRLSWQDPLCEMQQLGYRYAHFFNLMTPAAQERILNKLRAVNDARVFVPSDDLQLDQCYQPRLAVINGNLLYLVSFFGSNYRLPEKIVDQGFVSAYVHVVKDNMQQLGRWPFEGDCDVRVYHRINDRFWEDRLRMLVFPVAPAMAQAQSLQVGAFKIVDATAVGFKLEEISRKSLIPQAGAEGPCRD
jgi:hypothetical protein